MLEPKCTAFAKCHVGAEVRKEDRLYRRDLYSCRAFQTGQMLPDMFLDTYCIVSRPLAYMVDRWVSMTSIDPQGSCT